MLDEIGTIAPPAWVLLALAAVCVGIAKTAIPGINTVSIAIFAAVLPARASTGALLLLLIVGDVFALLAYRKHADWPTLVKLIPAVIVGLALGAVFLAVAADDWVRRAIGVILLLVIAFTLGRRWLEGRSRAAGADGATDDADAADVPGAGAPSPVGSAVGEAPGSARARSASRFAYGALGGFTTMVANAGGPVMSMYFLAARFPVRAFLGTAAWFFAVINLTKVPISVGLGLITPGTLAMDLLLVPGVVAGALVGRWLAARMAQRVFDRLVVGFTVLGAVYLLVA